MFGLFLAVVAVAIGEWGVAPAYGQPDTTGVASSDTTRPVTARRPSALRADTAQAPPEPRLPPAGTYGRPVLDSLPARTPLVGVEHVLAQRPGSFLYDLGAVGWPHGWSSQGLAPHRAWLWLERHPYNDPVWGRPRADLLPPALLRAPRVGAGPGGTAVGIHASWREYDQQRPITDLRFRRDNNGLQAIEVAHSQKRTFGPDAPGVLQVSLGYGGRATGGAYAGSDLRSERRLWGRLRYLRNDWGVEVSDFSSRHRIGAHGGVQPPGAAFRTIYVLPPAENSVRNPGARRRTFRNDLSVRAWGPVLPDVTEPAEASVTWTTHTVDYKTGGSGTTFGGIGDTTWTVRATGGHATARQSVRLGQHALTVDARGSLWGVGRTNVPQISGTRWATHLLVRDSTQLAETDLVLDAGWHATDNQQYPSLGVEATRRVGPLRLSASASLTGQRAAAWAERDGFAGFVRPLGEAPSDRTDRVLTGTVAAETDLGPIDLSVQGFAHQIRGAVDLYAVSGATPALTDTVAARRLRTPVRRAGGIISVGWRRAADRGLYATASATGVMTFNDDASRRHARLARTLPRVHGQGRLGARFVLFQDLNTDLYVQARGWSAMNSRWFHTPTGRLAVPPLNTPVPAAPRVRPGPSGTVDVHAETTLRGATLFFTFENVQAGTDLQPGTFVVPVYPLPIRQFRFGVYWPIFD